MVRLLVSSLVQAPVYVVDQVGAADVLSNLLSNLRYCSFQVVVRLVDRGTLFGHLTSLGPQLVKHQELEAVGNAEGLLVGIYDQLPEQVHVVRRIELDLL